MTQVCQCLKIDVAKFDYQIQQIQHTLMHEKEQL